MTIIKSFSVGNGDMVYIRHNSDNFSIIDCNLTGDRDDEIIKEIKHESKNKGVTRFISTHPDQDHISGIEKLDDEITIRNFYVVKNAATKTTETESFKHYCALRDGDSAFYIYKGCSRKWMNKADEERKSAGINIHWPDTENNHFKEALDACNAGESFNNVSCILRYSVKDGASVMWLGDLETQFMENIVEDIDLPKTTIVFASHHGRKSGKIPDSWLEKLDPQIIIIGEAPSRDLDYYTGYKKITQNRAGDITMHVADDKVHFYVSDANYSRSDLDDEQQTKFPNYIGSITVETEYSLD